MRLGILLFMVLFYVTTAQAETCYVLVEKAGNFNPKIVQSSSLPLINEFIAPVRPVPIAGIRESDCTYTVNLTESMQGFLVSLSGQQINSIGNSRTPGLNGFTQALLRAIYRSKNDESLKQKICQRYTDLMAEDCKPVEAVIFFYDGAGRMIEEGSRVTEGDEFNIMIKPTGNLYAYVINQDTKGNLFRIFPNQDVSPHANPLQAGVQYYFPPKNTDIIFSFDNNIGQEMFYFVISSTPMDDIDEMFRQLGNTSDHLRVASVLKKTIRSRGLVLKSKKTAIKVPPLRTQARVGNKIAELLQGKGAFVKTVSLNHVR